MLLTDLIQIIEDVDETFKTLEDTVFKKVNGQS